MFDNYKLLSLVQYFFLSPSNVDSSCPYEKFSISHVFPHLILLPHSSTLQMLGYDISWAGFNIIEVMSSTKFTEKRIGYLSGVATMHFSLPFKPLSKFAGKY